MKMTQKNYHQPLFTIGIVAEMLGITPTTLRTWEKRELIEVRRRGKNRYYSFADIDRLKEIKRLLRDRGMNIAGVKTILDQTRCWKVKDCGEDRFDCVIYQTWQEKNNPETGRKQEEEV